MKPSLPTLVLAVVVTVSSLAAPSSAQPFEPCSDAATSPALAGSLCMVARMPLHPVPDGGSPGESVDLFVRTIPAPDALQRRGQVWFVAGGPGETGASFLPVLPVLRRAFPNHDLIFPDHRGTGYSSKLCPEQEAPGSPDGISLAGEEWGPCIGFMHANAARTRAFTISNGARDLSALIRRHGGEGETYLYGVSYGTQLVLRMMQVAPVELTGIILDGLVPPESASRWDLSHRTQVVDAVGRAALTPDQVERYRELLARKDSAWQAAVPGGNLRQLLAALLNFPELRDRIPVIVDGLSRNDPAPLTQSVTDLQARMAELYGSPQSPPSLPLVMLISGSENNGRRDLTRELVTEEAAGALFTSAIPDLLVNSSLPLYDLDAFFGRTPGRLPRTLVIHGTLDPNTPYEGAKAHVALLSRAGDVRLTTVTGGAHFLPVVAPGCFVQAASAFVAGEPAPDHCEEASCQAGLQGDGR